MSRLSTFLICCLLLCLLLANGCAPTVARRGEAALTAPSLPRIEAVSYVEEEQGTTIRIENSEEIRAHHSELTTHPLKILVDFPRADFQDLKMPLSIDNDLVGKVEIVQLDDRTRFEVGLKGPAAYAFSQEGAAFFIHVQKAGERPNDRPAAGREKPVEAEASEAPSPGPIRAAETGSETLAPAPPGLEKEAVLPGPPMVAQAGSVEPTPAAAPLTPVVENVPLRSDSVEGMSKNGKETSSAGQPKPASAAAQQPGKGAEIGKAGRRGKTNALTEIDFKRLDDKCRIFASFAEEPEFDIFRASEKEITINVRNASVPKRLQRPLDTSAFEGAVSLISLHNVKTGKSSDVRIVVKLKDAVPFEAAREGKLLLVDLPFPAGKEGRRPAGVPVETQPADKKAERKVPPEPKISEKAVAEEKQAVPRAEAVKPAEKRTEERAPSELKKPERVAREEKAVSPASATIQQAAEKKESEPAVQVLGRGYAGKRLSLDFKDADIKNILRLIAEVSSLNIIAGDDVTGKVTMRLVDVPWDHALDVILQARALGMTQLGNVIRVAPVDTLKKEIQADLESRRTKERLEDLVTELISVNYATAKEIIPQVKSTLSDRGDVKVDDRTNTLIVKDIPRNIPAVRRLVSALDTKTPQVLIEARIVEASLAFQRDLGVKWGFLAQGNGLKVGGGTPGTTLGSVVNNLVNLPAQPTSGSTAGVLEFLFTSMHGIRQIDLAISASESKGEVNIVSSPKIATLDNKEASIEQGLRIPYPKLTTEGTVTTDFIEANLKLVVIPHVTNDGHIKMSIKAKKDAPIFDKTKEVLGVPPIDKKEAITEVLVKDNGVVVIAGIYTIEKDNSTEGVPLFNRIPLLGWLFKRETKIDTRKDLLIFICPKIVRDPV